MKTQTPEIIFEYRTDDYRRDKYFDEMEVLTKKSQRTQRRLEIVRVSLLAATAVLRVASIVTNR